MIMTVPRRKVSRGTVSRSGTAVGPARRRGRGPRGPLRGAPGRGRAATAAALVALALAATPAAPAAGAAPKAPVGIAGADLISVSLDGGRLSLRVRDADQRRRGEAGHEPGAVVLGRGAASMHAVPSAARFAFLGSPGERVWTLTSAGGDFPAWDASGVPRGRLAGDQVRVRLLAAEGPGRFTAYRLSPVGVPTILLSSAKSGPDTVELRAGARRGGAIWAFDAPGRYRLTLAAEAKSSAGQAVTGKATYTVEVGAPGGGDLPADADAATPFAQAAGAAPRPVASGQARAAAAPAQATATGRKVISKGHVDMGPRLINGDWTVQLKDDTVSPHAWRNLADVVLHAVDKAKIEVPSGENYAFLGTAGQEVWLLPQTENPEIVWPGWNTQDPSVVSGTRGNVTWTLRSVDGPGKFALFLTGSFGAPQVLFDSGKALPQRLTIPPNTHAHGNWAFSEPGIYRLGVQMTGTATSGGQLDDTKTLTIAVGDATDPQDGFGPGGGGNGGGGDDDGDGDGTRSGGGLPLTGAALFASLGLAGATLLALGTAVVAATRRRRRSHEPAGLAADLSSGKAGANDAADGTASGQGGPR
jgi:surface-anchored protein